MLQPMNTIRAPSFEVITAKSWNSTTRAKPVKAIIMPSFLVPMTGGYRYRL
jgi:hypothetical protein